MKKRLHGDDLLTRAELAKAIGKSKTTIRRWETTGKLKPIVDEHGVHLFRVEDARRLNGGEPIQALPRARAYVANADRANGELGAQVFDLLLKKTPHVKIVTELRIHPNVLEGFLEACRSAGGVLRGAVRSREEGAFDRWSPMHEQS